MRQQHIHATGLATIACAFTMLALASSPVLSQGMGGQDRLTIDNWLEWERVGDPRISPDGQQVIYARRWVDKMR